MIGRILKSSVSRDIGVVIPNISNPFYTELVLGAETAANKRGYGLLLCNSLRSEAREMEYIESLYQKQVGGIILSSVSHNHNSLQSLIGRGGFRIMALDQQLENISHGSVDFQVKTGALMAMQYLIESGHRKIALLSSPPTVFSRREALRGYRQAFVDFNIPHSPVFELFSDREQELGQGGIYEFENGRLLADRLLALSDRPTAAFCVNDMTATGVLQRLSELGVSVPDDISVMGFDNIALSRMVSPALATVEQSPYEAGVRVGEALIDYIELGAPDRMITIEPYVVKRASVKCIPNIHSI